MKDEKNDGTDSHNQVNVLLLITGNHYCIVYKKQDCIISNTNVVTGVRIFNPGAIFQGDNARPQRLNEQGW